MSFDDTDFHNTSDNNSRFRSEDLGYSQSSNLRTSPVPDSEIDDIINKTGTATYNHFSSNNNNNNNTRDNIRNDTETDTLRDDKEGDLKTIKQAWISERTCPELLPFEHQVIERLMSRIRSQMEYIETHSMNLRSTSITTNPLSNGVPNLGDDTKLRLLIVETDMERAKFVIRGYLRTRLSKVDKFSVYFLESRKQQKKLSAGEMEYMVQ